MEKNNEQQYQEREKRIMDAITLNKPDRIPVWGNSRMYATERCHLTPEQVMMDLDKMLEANYEETLYFAPDAVEMMPSLGAVLSPLDMTQMKWPGHGLPANSECAWQWLEKECMTPEEYDELIYDPTDFMVRKYWPRAYNKLSAFSKLPPWRESQGYFGAPSAFSVFGTPEGEEALKALREAGVAAHQFIMGLMQHTIRLKKAGFPMLWAGATQPPFDFVGDFLRGRKGIMLDMFRRPDKILQAAEKLLPMAVEMGVRGAKMSGNPRVFIAIHGAVEGFMSVEQYKKFFWPTFRELLVQLIDADCYPFVLVEGGATSRLEIMADVPPGKVCYLFEDVDMAKAKKILEGKACICGSVPLSLTSTGTPDQVRDYCKNLIDLMGKDGGYIMSLSGSSDKAKIENVKTMIDFTKEYGAA